MGHIEAQIGHHEDQMGQHEAQIGQLEFHMVSGSLYLSSFIEIELQLV